MPPSNQRHPLISVGGAYQRKYGIHIRINIVKSFMFQAKPKKGKLQRLTTLLTEKLLVTAKFVLVKKAKCLFMVFSVSFEVKAHFKTLFFSQKRYSRKFKIIFGSSSVNRSLPIISPAFYLCRVYISVRKSQAIYILRACQILFLESDCFGV